MVDLRRIVALPDDVDTLKVAAVAANVRSVALGDVEVAWRSPEVVGVRRVVVKAQFRGVDGVLGTHRVGVQASTHSGPCGLERLAQIPDSDDGWGPRSLLVG